MYNVQMEWDAVALGHAAAADEMVPGTIYAIASGDLAKSTVIICHRESYSRIIVGLQMSRDWLFLGSVGRVYVV